MTDPSATPDPARMPASPWRRLAGLVYDLVAVIAIVMVVGMICQAATGGQLVQNGTQTHVAWWYPLLQYLVVTAYFVASWLRGGQTLGMRPWRMRLRMHDGARVGLFAALIRAGMVSLPLLVLAIGPVTSPRTAMLALLAIWAADFLATLFDRRRRALHDMLAGTELVRGVSAGRGSGR